MPNSVRLFRLKSEKPNLTSNHHSPTLNREIVFQRYRLFPSPLLLFVSVASLRWLASFHASGKMLCRSHLAFFLWSISLLSLLEQPWPNSIWILCIPVLTFIFFALFFSLLGVFWRQQVIIVKSNLQGFNKRKTYPLFTL